MLSWYSFVFFSLCCVNLKKREKKETKWTETSLFKLNWFVSLDKCAAALSSHNAIPEEIYSRRYSSGFFAGRFVKILRSSKFQKCNCKKVHFELIFQTFFYSVKDLLHEVTCFNVVQCSCEVFTSCGGTLNQFDYWCKLLKYFIFIYFIFSHESWDLISRWKKNEDG